MPLCPPVVSCCSLPLRVFAPHLATLYCHRLPLWVLHFAVSCVCCAALFCGFCAAAASYPSLRCVLRVLYGFLLQRSFCAAARRFISVCPESGLIHVCVCEANIFFCFCWAPFFRALFLRGGYSPCVLVFASVLVFSLERSQRCLLALPPVYFSQGVA